MPAVDRVSPGFGMPLLHEPKSFIKYQFKGEVVVILLRF